MVKTTGRRKRVDKIDRYMINSIVINNTQEDAVKQLIDDGLCVSKAEAKRVYVQKRAILKDELVEWISIECPRCGTTRNYSKTLSGTTPCSNSRCRKLIAVGKIEDADLDRIRHNG